MDCEIVISKEIQNLLKQHKSLQVIGNGEKVKCLRSGHEMPCQVNAILQYINGKKYKKYSAQPNVDMEKYKEVIVPSNKPGHEHQLFCTVTCRHMNNFAHHIELHVNGHRFQKAFKRWQHCQQTGETFKPNIGRRKERKDSESMLEDAKAEDEKNEEGSDDEHDDMSDLYPVEDFGALGLSTGEGASTNEASAIGNKKKHKGDDSVSYQVKRTKSQKKTKCQGEKKTKKMKKSD